MAARLRGSATAACLLAALGAPTPSHAQTPDRNEAIAERARKAAEKIRIGENLDTGDPRQRLAHTDEAIRELEALVAEAQAVVPRDDGLILRLRRDLVVAYRDRERWQDALDLAATLEPPHPAWVREAEADALLALRRPKEAKPAYAEVLAADPDFANAKIGRFYAEVELEDFGAAFATVDSIQGADALAARARSFADMQREAWERLEPLVEASPDDVGLHGLQGEFAAGRGWPRRSLRQISEANERAPGNVGFRIALAEALFRRRQWREAEAIADELNAAIPDNARLQRLRRDIDIHHGAELRAEVSGGQSSGGGPWVNGDSFHAAARLYSPPLAERWRVFAGAARDTAIPFDETIARNRYGAGVEGRWPDVAFELSAWNNSGALSKGGLAASATWQPDDHWTLSADAQKFSADTPLRAIDAGVTADSYNLGVGYGWNESHSVGVSLGAMDFSDGNHRLQFVANYAALVLDRPHLDIYVRPGLYASRNSMDAALAAYYNPSRDASLTVDLDIRHVWWRKYERSLAQRLVLSGGSYWQEGHGSGAIGGATYEQTWHPGPRTEWNYGVSWARRIYDGNAERATTAFVRLNRRF